MDSPKKNNTIVSLKTPWLPIDTPDSFFDQIWNKICLIAVSMNCTTAGQGQNLYYSLIYHGYKRKCYYETQVPHLVKVVVRKKEDIDHDQTKLMFRATIDKTTGFGESAMIEVSPRCDISSGLYLCTLSLKLSNPLWKIDLAIADTPAANEEDTSTKKPQVWILDEILENIPDGQSKKCNAEMTLTLIQNMGPLPPPPPSLSLSLSLSLLKSNILNTITTEEFRRCFNL
jgi:hypothetical protein